VPRLPRVSGKALVKVLQRSGFVLSHVRGSHHYLRRPGQDKLVTVPVHGNRDLPMGTLKSILRQSGLTGEELANLL
jgi:predicted RNA binding protein YcfA (HicA-like mRNA interferase family)